MAQAQQSTFIIKMYIRTAQKQEFNVGSKIIHAADYDSAYKQFSRLDLPFHHFSTVNKVK